MWVGKGGKRRVMLSRVVVVVVVVGALWLRCVLLLFCRQPRREKSQREIFPEWRYFWEEHQKKSW